MSHLVPLCPECDGFPEAHNEGFIPLGSLREDYKAEVLQKYPTPGERLFHAVVDPILYRPSLTVSVDLVEIMNLDDTDEIQAGEDGWIVLYGIAEDYGHCTRCGGCNSAVLFGSVRFEWLLPLEAL